MKHYLCLSLLIGILFISCSNLGSLVDKEKSDSYFISSKGQITYCQGGNWFELGSIPVQADAKSFEVLSTEIAKDKNDVFYRGCSQKQVDRNSFYIEHDIPKDRYHAYTASDGKLKKIEGADSKTFEYLSNNSTWAKDKDGYFLNLKKVRVDRGTFVLINKSFSEDKDSIYMATESGDFRSILQNTGDVKAINDQYMKSRKVIYYLAYHPDPRLLINPFDSIGKIRIIDNDIICVNNQIISYGKKFKYGNVDANSFQLFPPDEHQVNNDRYSKDRKNVYYDGEVIQGADVHSYTPLSFGFGKDAQNAFYEHALLKGVDSKSFKEIDTGDSTGFVFGDKFGNKFDYWTGKKLM